MPEQTVHGVFPILITPFDEQARIDAASLRIRYLIRHTAFHTLDHAWEMEDKDLTGKRGQHSISSE